MAEIFMLVGDTTNTMPLKEAPNHKAVKELPAMSSVMPIGEPMTTKTSVAKKTTKTEVGFCMIPQSDLIWVVEQKPAIVKLFHECWLSDPYGSRWMPLNTSLKDKTLKQAKAALRHSGLFEFKSEMRILEGKRYYETLVINLHGSRQASFWFSDGVQENPTSKPSQGSPEPEQVYPVTLGGVVENPTSSNQTQAEQEFQGPSISSQELLKEVLEDSLSTTQPTFERSATVDKAQEEVEPDTSTSPLVKDDSSVEDIKSGEGNSSALGAILAACAKHYYYPTPAELKLLEDLSSRQLWAVHQEFSRSISNRTRYAGYTKVKPSHCFAHALRVGSRYSACACL